MKSIGFEHADQNEIFVRPNLQAEAGEIERIAELYAPENEQKFIEKFLAMANSSQLIDLTEELWSQLENTDSFDIKMGEWGEVESHVSHVNEETGADREWASLKQKMEQGEALDAPIILKYDNTYHLVSGNTRLMVTRGLGKTPKVLIVEMTSEQFVGLENRESFLNRLEGKFDQEQIEEIDFAYDMAKESHRRAMRDAGGRYFEHPRSGCLIMMDELGLYDRDLLVSFLLHDVGEDTPMLGNVTKSYDEFRRKAEFRLNRVYGEKVADTVIRLTKPSVDNIRFHTKKEVYNFYIEELAKSEDAILLKMVDRLHNLRSLPADNPKRIKRQVEETRETYLPIFESVVGERKTQAEILVDKIKQQLSILESQSAS